MSEHASARLIRGWLIEAKAAGANFLLVACDHDGAGERDGTCCFPVRVWAETPNDVHQAQHRTMIDDSARVQEVYDLRADLDAMMTLRRCWLSPGGEGVKADGPLPDPPTREQILRLEMQPNERRAVPTLRSSGGGRPRPRPGDRPRPAPRVVDHEAPKSELEAELEKGVGALGDRLRRAVEDEA